MTTSRKHYIERKAAGVCVHCQTPVEQPGKVYCNRHLEIHRKNAKERKDRRRSAGICTCCGRNPPVDGAHYCQACREKQYKNYGSRERAKRSRERIKSEVYNAYGGAVCACCGETEPLFLTMDHIDENGSDHRRELFKKSGYNNPIQLYYWLKRNDFPKGFQVLCYNCNSGKYRNGGICPHKRK